MPVYLVSTNPTIARDLAPGPAKDFGLRDSRGAQSRSVSTDLPRTTLTNFSTHPCARLEAASTVCLSCRGSFLYVGSNFSLQRVYELLADTSVFVKAMIASNELR